MWQVLHKLVAGLGTAAPRRSKHYRRGESFGGFDLSLPPREAALLGAELSRAKTVLEYGAGGSTFLALECGVAHIISVESDTKWATRINAALGARFDADRFQIHHADIGATGAWGYPKNQTQFQRYPAYAAAPYDFPAFQHPDLVVIDGRFRVACFLSAMLRCTRPVRLVFDDYRDRPYYHWVERYAAPVETAGRMAVFDLAPRAFPLEDFANVLEAFVDCR
ncbi:MAG: hypothetical protein WD046_11485 [Paracoccaceae bacterium]